MQVGASREAAVAGSSPRPPPPGHSAHAGSGESPPAGDRYISAINGQLDGGCLIEAISSSRAVMQVSGPKPSIRPGSKSYVRSVSLCYAWFCRAREIGGSRFLPLSSRSLTYFPIAAAGLGPEGSGTIAPCCPLCSCLRLCGAGLFLAHEARAKAEIPETKPE